MYDQKVSYFPCTKPVLIEYQVQKSESMSVVPFSMISFLARAPQ